MKKLKKIIIFIIIIFIAYLLYNRYNVKDYILKQIYPQKYSEYVEKYSKQYNIDPLLIYSIIKAESNFTPESTSNSGAIGLMQLMKSTANGLDGSITEENLYDEETNIKTGINYFNQLLSHYNQNINLAIIAYNAGMGNVDKWIDEGTIKKDGSDLENVPFKETNNYVRKILRDYEMYKNLYN